MPSFPNAFVKFPWIKECLNAKQLFQPLVNLLVLTGIYYNGCMPFRLTCPQTLICSSGCFLFTVIAHTSLLVPTDISFSLPWPVQTKPSTQMFSYHQHSPHNITCPYKHLLSSVAVHGPTRPQDIYFSLTSPTQAYLTTQMLSSLCHGLHKSTCPYWHFLFTDLAQTGFLIHADAF